MTPSTPQHIDVIHRVLLNEDLLRIICGFLMRTKQGRPFPAEGLPELARVCRSISDIALDYIWRVIDSDALYSLFPADIVSVSVEGQKEFLHPPLSLGHWSRLHVYAPRIRSLTIYPSRLCSVASFAASPLAIHDRHSPFQNLTSIEWSSLVADVQLVAFLFTPTVVRVALTCVNASRPSFHVNPEVYDFTLADVLKSLEDNCPHLRRFIFHNAGNDIDNDDHISAVIEDSLASLIRSSTCLVELSIPTSPSIMDAAGRLPSLRTLDLQWTPHWEDRSQLQTQGCGCRPEKEENRSIFQTLHGLVLGDSVVGISLPSITSLLWNMRCFPRTTIIATCGGRICTASELTEFLQEIVNPDVNADLRTFSLAWRAPHVPVDEDTPVFDWEAFEPLFALRNLGCFSIDGFLLDMKDSDCKRITQIWPGMVSLFISTGYDSDTNHNVSRITFEGLVHLSTLTELQWLCMELDPHSDMPLSMLSTSRDRMSTPRSPLKTIELVGRRFPSVTVSQMTLFLVIHFPRLRNINTITGEGPDANRWKEAEDGLDAARKKLYGDNDEPMMETL